MNVIILNKSNFVTPLRVQSSIRKKFAFFPNKEFEVRYDEEEQSYDVYQDEQFICSFDENGNEL